jgi:4-amino-4-deoxy-L-arabinose transferase-like glycosyltransferase
MGTIPLRRRHFSVTWVILAVTVLVGATMRFYKLGALPPGLYHDEAFNGMDALRVLAGERPIFFEANNGREPLFLYGMALALSVFGRTPFAIRVMAAALGTLTVPATFLMGLVLFNKRVGLWSAALLAVAPWPINLSRIGLRAVSMPLLVGVATWLWWYGRRAEGQKRTTFFLAGGALFGLSLYTYTASRFVVVAIPGFVLFQTLVCHERFDRSEWLQLALAAGLTAMPLFVYGATHRETFVERMGQVSIFSPEISRGDPAGLLARNFLRAAGLFTFRGDSIPRHNIPSRPVFDPLVSVFCLLGTALCLIRVRRDGAYALALIWTGVMLVPTILAEDCPHFLRAVGVLPMAMLFPALGLAWAQDWLAQRVPDWIAQLMTAAVLVISAVWGGYDYYVHAIDPELAYAFEADQLQEAVEINQFLGTGWQGQGISEPPGEPIPARLVYLGQPHGRLAGADIDPGPRPGCGGRAGAGTGLASS